MSTKRFCDGCDREILNSPIPDPAHPDDASKARYASPGQPNDGLARKLELTVGGNSVVLDLDIECFRRVKSLLGDALPEMSRTRASWWPALSPGESD